MGLPDSLSGDASASVVEHVSSPDKTRCSDLDGSADTDDGLSTNPYRALGRLEGEIRVITVDHNTTTSAHRLSLRRDIVGRGHALSDQPLSHTGIEGSGNRVLINIHGVREGADLTEGSISRLSLLRGIKTNNTKLNLLRLLVGDATGIQHRSDILQLESKPMGSVDDPLRVNHILTSNAHRLASNKDLFLFDGSGLGERWSREGNRPILSDQQVDKADTTLLDNLLSLSLLDAALGMFEEGTAGTNGGVAGKGELFNRGVDPDFVIGLRGVGGREKEGGLGEICPVGDLLHLFVIGDGQGRVKCDDDGEGVAKVSLVSEDVELVEGVG